MEKELKPEMISLSGDLSLFDEANMTLEALEQRLEMAVIHPETQPGCGTFSCGSYGA